ncbi:lamin tail domain-containing protein [Dyadobacter jejuensis]|nr:lamin tail domain-containing protein [Dyadobacter jejuensis]
MSFRAFCIGVYSVCMVGVEALSQSLNDVVITELMADPTPHHGLPATEYLELYNRTAQAFSLKGWKLKIGNTSITLPDTSLRAYSYLILSHKANQQLWLSYGSTCGLPTLTLPNSGALLALYTSQNRLIFSLDYRLSWWPANQRGGGYSLEMMDRNRPCVGSANWRVSLNLQGGTPGGQNSVDRDVPDRKAPVYAYWGLVDGRRIRMVASERLDSLVVSQPHLYKLPGRSIDRVELESPLRTNILLYLNAPLIANQTYSLEVMNMTDCAGNRTPVFDVPVGIPLEADSSDVVISELLFNPQANGVDYVELANRSGKFIDLSGWSLGNLKNGLDANFHLLGQESILLAPHSFIILSTDGLLVWEQYPYKGERGYVDVSAMSAYVNSAGGVVLKDRNGLVVDRFLYSEQLHDPLLSQVKGVALERVDLSRSANEMGNWRSASAQSGYGTPGYENSQRHTQAPTGMVTLTVEGISPNNDGVDDAMEIVFDLASAGYYGTITIFDSRGRVVRKLLPLATLGGQDRIGWDGTDDQGMLVSGGYYFINTQIWSSKGFNQQFYNKVVVAR